MIPPTKETKRKKNRGENKKKQRQSDVSSAAQQDTSSAAQQATTSDVGCASLIDSSTDAFASYLNSNPMLDYLPAGVSRHEQSRNPPAGRVSQSLVDANALFHQSSIFSNQFSMNEFATSHPYQQQPQGIPLLQCRPPTEEKQDSTTNQIPFNMSRHHPDDQQQRVQSSRFDIMDFLHENSMYEEEETNDGMNGTFGNHYPSDPRARTNIEGWWFYANPTANINLTAANSSFVNGAHGATSSNSNGSNAGFRRGESFTSSLQAQMHRNPLGNDDNGMFRFGGISSLAEGRNIQSLEGHQQTTSHVPFFETANQQNSFGAGSAFNQQNNFGGGSAAELNGDSEEGDNRKEDQHEEADIVGAVAHVREAVVAQDQEQQDAVAGEDDENQDGLHQENDGNQDQVQQDEQPNDNQNVKKPDEKEERRYPRRDNILRIDYYEPDIPDDDEFLCEYYYFSPKIYRIRLWQCVCFGVYNSLLRKNVLDNILSIDKWFLFLIDSRL